MVIDLKTIGGMRSKGRVFLTLIGLVAMAISSISCDDPRTFDSYKAVEVNGWQRNDTATFKVERQWEGTYCMDLGIRANQNYPYKNISLIIERTVIASKKKKLPNKTYQDTITCRIIGDDGRLVGKRGITNSEITHHVCSFVLERNDSLNIAVRHIMSKEQLQGISDVGIRLIRTDKAIKQRIF